MQIISHAIKVFHRLTYEVLNKDVELESGEASVSPLRRQEKGEGDGGAGFSKCRSARRFASLASRHHFVSGNSTP